MDKKKLQEIKGIEKEGVDVIAIDRNGRIEYSTNGLADENYCDRCEYFRLLPDPDPYDWFRDGDMKAVCRTLDVVIEGSLERPSEWTNIKKPLYCPRLGRELTEEERKQAKKLLEWARKRS